MMARKAMNLLESESVMVARLRKVTDKTLQAQGSKEQFVSQSAEINWSDMAGPRRQSTNNPLTPMRTGPFSPSSNTLGL